MALLRRHYLAQLGAQKAKLEIFSVEKNLTDEQYSNLCLLAHNLAGSGQIYGFPEISRTGKALEESLLKKEKFWPENLTALIDSLEQALQSTPPYPSYESP